MAFFVPRKNNVASIHRQFLRLLMLLFALSTEAFHAASVSAMKVSALQAWSLPTESFAMKSTWYNEYNPTARATVYNEYVSDWNFALLCCSDTISVNYTGR